MKNSNSTSFFESVAHHNLERFHSETIAWIFRAFPNSAKEFILKIHGGKIEKNDIIIIKSVAEVDQIDIKLEYSIGKDIYTIFIENKLKAAEHDISSEKLIKELDKLKIKDNLSDFLSLNEKAYIYLSKEKFPLLSQTEYYYLREKLRFLSNKEKNNKEEKLENFKRCHFVYLKPSIIKKEDLDTLLERIEYSSSIDVTDFFDFEKSNQWNKKLGDNPWITFTHKAFTKFIIISNSIKPENEDVENFTIANSYLNYIQENLPDEVNLEDFNKNPFGEFEYFKFLFALVKAKLKDRNNYPNAEFFEYIDAGSANGGAPLFAFYKTIQTDENFTFFKDKKNHIIKKPIINLGIQLQGENFKYYISADEYDSTSVSNGQQKEYGAFVQEKLENITSLVEKEGIKFRFNSNSTKTFYSRSFKIQGLVEPNKDLYNKKFKPRNIIDIADEISERVNEFIETNNNI